MKKTFERIRLQGNFWVAAFMIRHICSKTYLNIVAKFMQRSKKYEYQQKKLKNTGTVSVVELHFNKVIKKISAFYNSAETLLRACGYFLKISSSRNITKFPFNWEV